MQNSNAEQDSQTPSSSSSASSSAIKPATSAALAQADINIHARSLSLALAQRQQTSTNKSNEPTSVRERERESERTQVQGEVRTVTAFELTNLDRQRLERSWFEDMNSSRALAIDRANARERRRLAAKELQAADERAAKAKNSGAKTTPPSPAALTPTREKGNQTNVRASTGDPDSASGCVNRKSRQGLDLRTSDRAFVPRMTHEPGQDEPGDERVRGQQPIGVKEGHPPGIPLASNGRRAVGPPKDRPVPRFSNCMGLLRRWGNRVISEIMGDVESKGLRGGCGNPVIKEDVMFPEPKKSLAVQMLDASLFRKKLVISLDPLVVIERTGEVVAVEGIASTASCPSGPTRARVILRNGVALNTRLEADEVLELVSRFEEGLTRREAVRHEQDRMAAEQVAGVGWPRSPHRGRGLGQ